MAFDGVSNPKELPAQDAEARLAALHRQAGALVHDFNNLLTVILNANAALAEDLGEDAAGHELIQVSQAAAEQGAILVARLLDLSQGSDTAPVDCAEAVAATARRARVAAPRNVTVEVRLTDAPLLTVADGAGLDSALLNLCVNATHAMPAGGVIMLTAQRWTLSAPETSELGIAPGRYVVVSVADDGAGMSPEILAQATEPFFTTRRGRGGTGLGLASVRDFAQGCGGAFVLTSREGRGTTGRLYLPAL